MLNFFSKSSYFLSKNKKKANIISVVLLSLLVSSNSYSAPKKMLEHNKQHNLINLDDLLHYEQKHDFNSLIKNNTLFNVKSVANIQEIIKDNKEGRLTYKQRLIAQHISNKYAKLDLKTANEIVKQAYIKAKKHNIDPEILIAIAGVESNYNPKIVNSIGASGLTQVVKKYHKDKISKVNAKGGNILTISDNLDVGAEIYSTLYKKYGNHTSALQAYNGSQKDKSKKYSKKVMRELKDIQLAYQKK